MPAETASTFACSACGKKFVWKPELAGKTVRCKCGQSIAVPAGATRAAPAVAAAAPAARPAVKSQLAPQTAAVRKAPKPAASAEPSLDDLYDLAADAAGAPSRPAAAMEPAAVAAPVAVPGMEDDAYRCPSCNEPMHAGSILCGSCGFNLTTGEKMTVKRAGGTVAKSAAGGGGGGGVPAGSAFSGIPTRSKPKFVEDKQGQMMKILLPVFLIIAVIGGIFAFKFISAHSGNTAPVSSGKGDDPDVAEKMENENPMELHAWFKQNPSRMMGELSDRQATAKADELEKMGAKKCYAFGSMMCLCMAVELPDDPAQRKALIDYRNKWDGERHYKPVKDEGQKYIILNFSL